MASLTEHDRARLATTRRLAALGPALGAVAAASVGLLGGTGSAGLSAFLAVTSATLVVAGLTTSLQLVVDEFRRVPTALHRLWAALGLFLAGLMLLVLATGASG